MSEEQINQTPVEEVQAQETAPVAPEEVTDAPADEPTEPEVTTAPEEAVSETSPETPVADQPDAPAVEPEAVDQAPEETPTEQAAPVADQAPTAETPSNVTPIKPEQETAPTAAPAQPTFTYLGGTTLDKSVTDVLTIILATEVSIVNELGGLSLFKTADDFTAYLEKKAKSTVQLLLPSGALVHVKVAVDDKTKEAHIGFSLNTEAELDVYSDRQAVQLFPRKLN